MKIQDPKGVWLVNRGQFRFVDGENGTIFEPQEPTKALRTQWVKNQSVIVRCIDPTQDNTDEAQAELDALNAQDEAERNERTAAAEAIMLADNEKLIAQNAALAAVIDDSSSATIEPVAEPVAEPVVQPTGKKK